MYNILVIVASVYKGNLRERGKSYTILCLTVIGCRFYSERPMRRKTRYKVHGIRQESENIW